MLDLDPSAVTELPVDQLGLRVLSNFESGGGWNSRNYILEANAQGFRDEALRAIAEAFAWLSARGLIAADPAQNSPTAAFVTRMGRRVLEDGPDVLHATERLQSGLHRLIEARARRQF